MRVVIVGSIGIAALVFLAILVVAVVTLASVLALRHIKNNNRRLNDTVRLNAQRESALREIAACRSEGKLRRAIEATADKAKFADWAITLSGDCILDAQIKALSQTTREGEEDDAFEIVRQIDGGFGMREAAVAAERRGSF